MAPVSLGLEASVLIIAYVRGPTQPVPACPLAPAHHAPAALGLSS